jgi:hypothetical protein
MKVKLSCYMPRGHRRETEVELHPFSRILLHILSVTDRSLLRLANSSVSFFTFYRILGAFTELRKATIRFIMYVCPSVRPSVRMEEFGSHWTDFYDI